MRSGRETLEDLQETVFTVYIFNLIENKFKNMFYFLKTTDVFAPFVLLHGNQLS
jgi:hypothetical protein